MVRHVEVPVKLVESVLYALMAIIMDRGHQLMQEERRWHDVELGVEGD